MHVDKSYLVCEDQATAGPPNEQNHRDGMRAQDISPIGTENLPLAYANRGPNLRQLTAREFGWNLY